RACVACGGTHAARAANFDLDGATAAQISCECHEDNDLALHVACPRPAVGPRTVRASTQRFAAPVAQVARRLAVAGRTGLQKERPAMTDEKVILLADDDPNDVELTLRAFRNNPLGNKIVVAHDGVEALDYLRGTGRHAGRDPAHMPQVVLLDLNLPVLDGLEVLRRIRAEERFRRLPIVILTSSNQDSDQ